MLENNPLRILIVDDSAMVREALSALVNCQADMQIVAEAADGAEGVEQYRCHQPDVTLMDLRMPKMNGVQAIIAICGEFPRACIVLLTASAGPHDVQEALRAGARRCLLKDTEPEEMLQTIRDVVT